MLTFARFWIAAVFFLVVPSSVAPHFAAQEADIRVAVVGAHGSDTFKAVRDAANGLPFANWWEVVDADAGTPFDLVIFDPATLDNAPLDWTWEAFARGVVFTGVGASYAEMRYVTGGLCTARGSVLPVTLPGEHAITFYLTPEGDAATTEASLRGCIMPDKPLDWFGASEGVLIAPLNQNGVAALLETIDIGLSLNR